jgi:hypothetical protein
MAPRWTAIAEADVPLRQWSNQANQTANISLLQFYFFSRSDCTQNKGQTWTELEPSQQ